MTRFVQIAWLKSWAQLFGDLKEILVQRDVDVDYRGGPIIFFSAQIPQFAYARNRICPTSRGDPTPTPSFRYQFIVTWNPNSLTRPLLAISYRYDTDIIRILILVFDTGARPCVHSMYINCLFRESEDLLVYQAWLYIGLKYDGKASWLIG